MLPFSNSMKASCRLPTAAELLELRSAGVASVRLHPDGGATLLLRPLTGQRRRVVHNHSGVQQEHKRQPEQQAAEHQLTAGQRRRRNIAVRKAAAATLLQRHARGRLARLRLEQAAAASAVPAPPKPPEPLFYGPMQLAPPLPSSPPKRLAPADSPPPKSPRRPPPTPPPPAAPQHEPSLPDIPWVEVKPRRRATQPPRSISERFADHPLPRSRRDCSVPAAIGGYPVTADGLSAAFDDGAPEDLQIALSSWLSR